MSAMVSVDNKCELSHGRTPTLAPIAYIAPQVRDIGIRLEVRLQKFFWLEPGRGALFLTPEPIAGFRVTRRGGDTAQILG